MIRTRISGYALRGILVIVGAIIVYLGLNVSLGGIRTLGWQDARPFLEVVNIGSYAVHDSHVRFFGGMFVASGLIIFAGAFALNALRPILLAIIAMIFVGGLARLSAGDAGLLLGHEIGPSLLAELTLLPLLAAWIKFANAGPEPKRSGLPRSQVE